MARSAGVRGRRREAAAGVRRSAPQSEAACGAGDEDGDAEEDHADRHRENLGPDGAKVHRPRSGFEDAAHAVDPRSEEHTSELQSLMRISYAVFCLKKKKTDQINKT